MLYAYVRRFDVMDTKENFLELNRGLNYIFRLAYIENLPGIYIINLLLLTWPQIFREVPRAYTLSVVGRSPLDVTLLALFEYNVH